MNYLELAESFTEKKLQGRYIALQHIQPLLEQELFKNGLSILGYSLQNRPIYCYKTGSGSKKILLWSQMHGDESTTTKALFDFFNFLNSSHELALLFKEEFCFCFVPMLNPDGAFAYTRENANLIDLNRDAIDLSQPESVILKKLYLDFQPDYCFNLHDQRSIYGAGTTGKAAIVSFLAPAYNTNREVNDNRNTAINVISAVNRSLSQYIDGHIGRFDDTFNPNCVGDTFQSLGTPTILFEAGHFDNDYNRDFSRKLIFAGYLNAFKFICENDVVSKDIVDYLLIPQNIANFYDIIYNNVTIYDDGIKKMINFAIQYKEVLVDDEILFFGYVVAVDNLEKCFGHNSIDCCQKKYSDAKNNYPEIGTIADFSLSGEQIFNKGLKLN